MNPMPPLLSRAIIIILLTLVVMTTRAGALTTQQCTEDFNALIAEIERNRKSVIINLNQQLAEADTHQQRDSLKFMLEQVWDDEESQRATAGIIRRDCEKEVNVNG